MFLVKMQRAVLFLVFLLPSLVAAQPQAFEEDGRWGFRDGNRIVIEPQYLMALDFLSTGIGAVVDDSGWVYVDTSGTRVIRPHVVDNGPDPFREGFARFVSDGKLGYFDSAGHVTIEARYDYGSFFSEGLAAVCIGCRREQTGEHVIVRGGRWGFINHDGCISIPIRYEAAEPFIDGAARAKLDGVWHDLARSTPTSTRCK